MAVTSDTVPVAKKGKGGRPPKLTKEVQAVIVNTIRSAGYLDDAAALAGINQDTLRDWMRQGSRASSGKYKEFSESVKRAQAEIANDLIAGIKRVGEGVEVKKTKSVFRENKANPGKPILVEQTVETYLQKEWTALAWILERKFPSKWGRRDHLEIAGDTEKPLVVQQQLDPYSGEYISALMKALSDVKLIPNEIMEAIDVTPANGNGRLINPEME